MSAILRLLLALIITTLPCHASDLVLGARYKLSTIGRTGLDATVIWKKPVRPWLFTEVGARLELDAIQYKGEASGPAFAGISPIIRLGHAMHFSQSASATTLFAGLGGEWQISDSIGAFIQLGWYERMTALSSPSVFPTFPAGNFRDHDFAVRFGMSFAPAETFLLELIAGSVEEVEIYRLNNPYVQLGARYFPTGESWSLAGYARYRMLLGFGRIDDTTLAASVMIPLDITRTDEGDSSPNPR